MEVCRKDLFTKEEELLGRYPQTLVDKVLRIREMYAWFVANPDATDREFVGDDPRHIQDGREAQGHKDHGARRFLVCQVQPHRR